MRILQLNKYYPPHRGGIETTVQTIANMFCVQTDMRILVCGEHFWGQSDTENGVQIRRCGRVLQIKSMPVSLRYLCEVRKLCRETDITLLHMPFPWGDLALRLSGYRGKVALWWHSDIVRQKYLLNIYKPLMQWTLRRADIIIVATQGHIEGSPFLEPFRKKCRIIPFGVSEEYLFKGGLCKSERDKGPIRFLFIGRMVYYKGCDILIRAFAKMKKKDCVLTMVGEQTPLSGICADLAKGLGVAERVIFTGDISTEEVQSHLAECDVFVLPSVMKSEAFGLVQLEAMAYGKPVINTALPSGVPWVSIDGETGITVEPSNVQALSEAMERLAQDDGLRQRYGAAARKRVEECFTLEHMRERLTQEFAGLFPWGQG